MANGGGGAAHREWRRHGWETLTVHEVGKKSAMVCSLRELERWEDKGERRGFTRWGRRAGGHVPKRRKKGGGRGVPVERSLYGFGN